MAGKATFDDGIVELVRRLPVANRLSAEHDVLGVTIPGTHTLPRGFGTVREKTSRSLPFPAFATGTTWDRSFEEAVP